MTARTRGICHFSTMKATTSSSSDTELVMLMMTEEYFPPIIYALTIAAILAVIMSTTDSYLILSAQTVTTDIVCRVKGIKSQKEVVLISRISVVAVGVFALLYALKMSNIFESMMLSMTQFSAGIAVPALAALFSKRVTRQGMLASMIPNTTAASVGITTVKIRAAGTSMVKAMIMDPNTTTGARRYRRSARLTPV